MKKILVPIDFSENTSNSIQAACDIADQFDCSIILLYSYFEMLIIQSIPTVSSIDMLPVIEPEITSVLHKQAEKEMMRWVKKIKEKQPELEVQSLISAINLKEKVIEICDKEDIMMIIMSATGTGKKDSFSGSAASTLFDSTPVPIIAIPENYIYDQKIGFKNILYATDFSEVAESEIHFILNHFLSRNNKIFCSHLRFDDKDTLKENIRLEELSKNFHAEKIKEKIVFNIIETTNVEEVLELLTETNDIGLISFHEHNRNFFYRFFHRSVVKKNIYRFNIPLLVFRTFDLKQ